MSAVRRALSLLSLVSLPLVANAQDPKPVKEPTPRDVRPPGPAKVTVKVASPTSFVITWDSVPGAIGYDIGRLAGNDGWQRVGGRRPAGTTEAHDYGRQVMTPHTYRVVAIVGNLASAPTTSEPVKGEPGAAGPGTANSPVPRCDYSADQLTMNCVLTKSWQGGTEATAGLEVGCPTGAHMVTGGYESRLVGYQVVRSAPRGTAGTWSVRVQRTPSVSVPPTVVQELVAIAMCRANR